MSQEEKEAVGFRIILDIIYWIETLDWEKIHKKKVRKREKHDIDLVLATENKTGPPLPQATVNHRACV
jgi:hypothetical protein